MKDEDKPRFSILLFWLAKRMLVQGGKPREITPDLIADWFDALQDVRIERLEWGAKRLFATEKWFPVPMELRAAAMLAPSSVLPKVTAGNYAQLAEFSEQQVADAKRRLADLVAGLVDQVAL